MLWTTHFVQNNSYVIFYKFIQQKKILGNHRKHVYIYDHENNDRKYKLESRVENFVKLETVNIISSITWNKIFKLLPVENRRDVTRKTVETSETAVVIVLMS